MDSATFSDPKKSLELSKVRWICKRRRLSKGAELIHSLLISSKCFALKWCILKIDFEKLLHFEKWSIVCVFLLLFIHASRSACWITDVTAETIIATSHGRSSKTPLIIFHEWHYIALAVANQLCLSGFLGAQSNQLRHFHFEHSIKSISGTNKLCTVLLANGIAHKIDLGQLQPIELNAALIKPAAPSNTIRAKSIFGVSNDIGRSIDTEFITHFASGRSFSIAITNKNAVYNVPLKIFTFPAHIKIRKICCGNEHCLILTTNGDLYAFGSSSWV